jgi:hypothetical protein
LMNRVKLYAHSRIYIFEISLLRHAFLTIYKCLQPRTSKNSMKIENWGLQLKLR